MSSFDPEKLRSGFLRGDGIVLRLFRETRFDANAPMGNIARTQINALVQCWLVGLRSQIGPLAGPASEWLDYAIAMKEEFGENQAFHDMEMYAARAMSNWLDNGSSAVDDWAMAADSALAAWRWPGAEWNPKVILRDGLQGFVAYCVQSAQYERGIAVFEQYVDLEPMTLGQTQTPTRWAYAVCLHHARDQFDEAELFQAGLRILRSNLNRTWISKGRALDAAMWLKMVYRDRDLRAGRAPSLTPLQTVLKAYENMDVALPESILLQAA